MRMIPFSSPLGKDGGRRWPVRLILFGIVFALVLPGIVFCAVLLNQIATAERTRSEEAAQSAALRTADTLDRELSNLVAAMVALSTSPALDDALEADGDPGAFARQARAVARALDHDVVLSTVEGQQLTNSRDRIPGALPGGMLPRMASMDTVRQAVRTHVPAVSPLFASGSNGEPSVAVIVPIVRDTRVLAVLGINLQPASISQLLVNQNLPAGWVAAVVDSADRVFARSESLFIGVGQQANADFRAHGMGDRGIWIGTQLDGVRVLAAMQRQRLADWRVTVSVPVRIVEAPLRGTVVLLVITGFVTLSIAGLLAWRLASSVGVPLQRLAAAGGALGAGAPVLGVRSAIAEVDQVSRALVQATHDLRARADALAAERAQLVAVIETVPVGLVIAEGPEGRVAMGNQYLAQMLRRPPLRDTSAAEFARWAAQHPDGTPVQPEEFPLNRVLNGAAQAEIKCVLQRGDGTPLWIQCAAAPILAADGRVTGGVVAVLDIDETVRGREALARFAESLETQVAERTAALEASNQRLRDEMAGRQAVEEQLRQSQKMEAVGQLTGGIAHDFNNLLTIIMGSLDLLRRRAEDDRSRRLLDNALEGTVRAATLTARLLAFSRRQPLKAEVVDVNALVGGMSDLLHRTLGEAVRVETVLADGLWQTHADANQLENALLNLAVNARDAMADGGQALGRLVIETGNAALDAAELAGEPDVLPGDYVCLAVTDTGSGMTPEVVARVFEPFFTTKPQGEGTGLGLSQVHGFVKQSGGHVAIRTRPGEGTTVRIYLPRYEGAQSSERGTGNVPLPAEKASGLTVLVVEDEAGVRRYSIEALQELGHVVLEAEDGPGALRVLDAHPEVELLFTDVVLPRMNGARLAEEVRRRRPGLPVLFTSGYTGGSEGRDPLIAPGSLLLKKPFDLRDLADKLREAVAH